MINRRISFALLFAIAPQLALAADRKASLQPQAVSIASPVIGYMLSGDELIAIEGISGAAHTRTIAASRGGGTRLVLPPGQNYQWIERRGQAYVADASGANLRNIPGAWTAADLIAFSSDGSAAALYRTAGQIQILTGLPSAPTVARQIAAPAAATSIALSDDTNTLLLGAVDGVYSSTQKADWSLVLAGAANAIAFIPGGSDAIAAAKDQTYLLRNSMTAEFLTGDSARAIATSTDGRLAILLSVSGVEALVVDLQTRTTKRLQLGALAQDVQRGRDNALVFIPRQGASPWLLDTASGVLSFAPALPETARGR